MNFFEWMKEQGKGEMTWEQLAQKFGYRNGNVTKGLWRRHQDAIRAGKSYIAQGIPTATTKSKDSITGFTEDIKKGEAEITAVFANEIRTLDELIAKTKIDTDVWEITKYVQNYWGNGNSPHWQVKAWLSKKQADPTDRIMGFFDNYKSNYKPIKSVVSKVKGNPVSMLISLADPHIDKVEIAGTTIEDKCAQYLDVLDNLLCKSYTSHNIDEIVYVLGNDFFTSDTYWNTTTATTPQSVTNEYDSAYEAGFELAIKSINKLKQFCNKLHVLYVPGNHDRTKSFYLVHALSVYFQADKNIIFDRTADNTKAYEYGVTGIFFHHGDCAMNQLPLFVASKYREMWGRVKYSEVALADKHHKKEWKYNLANTEDQGTRMFICPALTGADRWHTDKLYGNSIQAGICRLYDVELGKVAEFECRA